jgi:hypothetical protein
MNRAGRSRRGQLDSAGPGQAGMLEPGDALACDPPAGDPASADAGRADAQADGPMDNVAAPAPPPTVPGPLTAQGPPRRLRAAASRPVVQHLALLVGYLAAGVVFTWPRADYLGRHLLPETRDVSGYVWDLWWTAHQVIHLGNPFFTSHMAAPVGTQLGFDTTMPLAGLIMTPVTLGFGPSAAFGVLTIITPGLACYMMYRAARLWLSVPGAIAAGALFGLSSMVAWQDWYHLNIALGTLFLPMTLEAAVRLRRRPGLRQGVILGLVLGASVLVNQESAVLAVLLAAAVLVPWLLGDRRSAARLGALAVGGAVALVVASPQLIAMAQQVIAGGATVNAHLLAHTGKSYGVGLVDLFAPVQRIGSFGLTGLAAATARSDGRVGEGMPMFGLVLSVLAVFGLAVSWRRRSTWLFTALWLVCAWLALGAVLWIGRTPHVPLREVWNGERVSPLMLYTWVMRVPGLSALREADRFALLGLVGAAMLAGTAVDWILRRRQAWSGVGGAGRVAVVAVVAALAVLEAGWSGTTHIGKMPTTLPALDRAIAADRSQSIVVDAPFGLRGGIPLYGGEFAAESLVMATSDGHPRAVSYTSWVPAATIAGIRKHPFYTVMVGCQSWIPGKPVVVHASAARLAAARRDAREMGIGWVLVWTKNPVIPRYLTDIGFRLAYRADGVAVYRPAWR